MLIALSSSDSGTNIELVHTQLASEESAARHNEGWRAASVAWTRICRTECPYNFKPGEIEMKAAITSAIALGLLAMTSAGPATAQMEMEHYKRSVEFEQLKQLIGVWEGEMPMKGKSDKGSGEAKHEGMPEKMMMTVE